MRNCNPYGSIRIKSSAHRFSDMWYILKNTFAVMCPSTPQHSLVFWRPEFFSLLSNVFSNSSEVAMTELFQFLRFRQWKSINSLRTINYNLNCAPLICCRARLQLWFLPSCFSKLTHSLQLHAKTNIAYYIRKEKT